LKELGRWEEDSKAIGLPKIVHRKAAVGKKDKAAKEGQEQETSDEQPAPSEEKK
jgi:hypothetical protein